MTIVDSPFPRYPVVTRDDSIEVPGKQRVQHQVED